MLSLPTTREGFKAAAWNCAMTNLQASLRATAEQVLVIFRPILKAMEDSR